MKFLHVLRILGEQILTKKNDTNVLLVFIYSRCLTKLVVIRNIVIKQSVLVSSCYHTFVLVIEFR